MSTLSIWTENELVWLQKLKFDQLEGDYLRSCFSEKETVKSTSAVVSTIFTSICKSDARIKVYMEYNKYFLFNTAAAILIVLLSSFNRKENLKLKND